ncbi:MAG: hypothetical protein ABFD85_07365 [Phycisphaerae bacterium]
MNASRIMMFLLLAATVCSSARAADKLAPGCKEWKDTDFVHPPLKVFEPYKRFDEYPIVAWCFHGEGGSKPVKPGAKPRPTPAPYDESYAVNAKAAGFNVLIDSASMLEPCRKVGGIKVVVPAFHHAPDRLKAGIFDRHGDHPCLVGIVTDDNNPRIYPNVIENAKWITENYPHIMPWDSENPDPRTQSKTTMRVVGTQNYAFLRGAKGDKATSGYCNGCNFDRAFGNANNMSMWELFGGNVATNQIRFQMMAALAYGAQGLVNFAYTPHRDTPYRGKMYQPDSPLIPQFKAMHDYIRLVAGRHLWGCRSFGVLHSVHGGAHRDATVYDESQLVVRAAEFSLVGLLSPEKEFFAQSKQADYVPEYFLFVDKRTSGHDTPALRDAYVMLAARISAVEVLDEQAVKGAAIRKIAPAFKVRFKTEGGQGLLLRVAPDMDELLGGPEGMAIYKQINATLASLQWQATAPAAKGQPKPEAELTYKPVDARTIDQAVAAAKAKTADLAKLLDAAAAAGKISKAQADDTLNRLNDAIDATSVEAKDPKPSAS